MAKLPHVKNSSVAQDIDEALTLERFEVTCIPPSGIVVPQILTEEITSFTGFDALDKLPEVQRQISKGYTRIYSSSFVDDTTVEFSMTINMNLSGTDANQALIYKMFKEWGRTHRNELTGANSLKRDYVGQFIVDMTNHIGTVWKHVELLKCILTEITGLDEMNVESQEAAILTVSGVAEDFNLVLS